MIVIDERHLTVVAELGAGSSRTVYRVTCHDPRLPAQLAFKVPRPAQDPGFGRLVLDRMYRAVALRDQLSANELGELDSVTTLPLAMVARDGRSSGCLTRIVDQDYFVEARPAGGGPVVRLYDLGLLSASSEQLRALGIARAEVEDALVRLAIMARLAYAMQVIHSPHRTINLVYGDLNPRSVVVAVEPPRVRLLGGDDLADGNDPSGVQLNTPFFVPPELTGRHGQQRQDQLTDVYKLGLCVIRGLSAGRGAAQVIDAASPVVRPGLLDAAGVDLLNRAVGVDRHQRPTAEAIKDYLIGRVLRLAENRVVRSR